MPTRFSYESEQRGKGSDRGVPRCRIEARPSRKSRGMAGRGEVSRWSGAAGVAGGRSRPSGGRERVAVKLEEVVGGGDQPPFRADGGAASSLEAIDATVVLGLAEHGLDHRLALPVEPAAALGG